MSSKRRLKVLCSLTEGPLTQKHIHRHTGIPLANLGRVLDEMKGGEIVISRTRQMRKFKTYGLTPRGKTVQDYLIALVWAKREGGVLTPLEEQLYGILEDVLDESAQASGFGTWR